MLARQPAGRRRSGRQEPGQGGGLRDQEVRLRHAGPRRRVPVPRLSREGSTCSSSTSPIPSATGTSCPRGVLREPVKHLQAGQLHLPDQVRRQPGLGARGDHKRKVQARRRHHRMRPQAHVPAEDATSGTGAGGSGSPLVAEGPRVLRLQRDSHAGELREVPEGPGALLMGRERFLDHYRYTPEDIDEL